MPKNGTANELIGADHSAHTHIHICDQYRGEDFLHQEILIGLHEVYFSKEVYSYNCKSYNGHTMIVLSNMHVCSPRCSDA